MKSLLLNRPETKCAVKNNDIITFQIKITANRNESLNIIKFGKQYYTIISPNRPRVLDLLIYILVIKLTL